MFQQVGKQPGTTESTNAHYRGFPSGEFHSLNYAAEVYKKPTRTENTTRRVSVLASANYTWNDIYLVDASVRFDGSSEFGANQKWALSSLEVWVLIFITMISSKVTDISIS